MFCISKNVLKLSYSNAEFKHFPGDNTPDPRFWGEESLFLFYENQNCPTVIAMQNSKFFPGTFGPSDLRTLDLRFMEEENLFSFSKTVLKFSYSNAEFKTFPGDITRTPVLGEMRVCFRSPKMYQNSRTALKKKSGGGTPGPPFSGRGCESCLLLKICLATPLNYNLEEYEQA